MTVKGHRCHSVHKPPNHGYALENAPDHHGTRRRSVDIGGIRKILEDNGGDHSARRSSNDYTKTNMSSADLSAARWIL